MRRVRTTERLEAAQAINDHRTGTPYKVMKRDSNHCMELWRMPDGSYQLPVISTFAAAQKAEAARLGRQIPDQRPHPAAKLLMRLHKRDMVTVGMGENSKLMSVVMISDGQLALAEHNEGGILRNRHRSRDDPFKYRYLSSGATLIKAGVRKVFVTPDGRVMSGDQKK